MVGGRQDFSELEQLRYRSAAAVDKLQRAADAVVGAEHSDGAGELVDCVELRLAANVGVILGEDLGIVAQYTLDHRQWHAQFRAMAGKGVTQRVETIDVHAFVAARGFYRCLYAGLSNDPHHIDVHKVASGVLPCLVRLMVTLGNMGADIVLRLFPCQRFAEDPFQLRCNGQAHDFSCLVLFNLHLLLVQVDIAPSREHAVFQTLPGVDAQIEYDADFLLVLGLSRWVLQRLEKPLFLFGGEAESPMPHVHLLARLAQQSWRVEGIGACPVIPQGFEDFPYLLDFAVVRGHGVVFPFAQEIGEAVGILVGDVLQLQFRFAHELHKLCPSLLVGLPLTDGGWHRPFGTLQVPCPGVRQSQVTRVFRMGKTMLPRRVFLIDDPPGCGVVPGFQRQVVPTAVGLVAEVEPAT